jgi:hypothetical protein
MTPTEVQLRPDSGLDIDPAGIGWVSERTGLFVTALFVFTLCCLATLTISVESRWAECAYWLTVYGVAGIYLVRAKRCKVDSVSALLLCVATAGGFQLVAGRSEVPVATLLSITEWTGAAALFWITSQALDTGRSRERFLGWFELFGIFICSVSLLQISIPKANLIGSLAEPLLETIGPFQSRNNYAAFVELLIPVLFWRAAETRRFMAARCFGCLLLLISIVATGSRAGFVLACSEVIVLLVLSARGYRVRLSIGGSIAIAGILLLIICVVAGGKEGVFARFHTADPFVYRREILQSGLAMWRERPVVGFGLGTFPTVYPSFALFDSGSFVQHAHNDWLEWAVDGGAMALVPILLIACLTVVPAFRSVWGIGILSVYIHSLVDFHLHRLGIAAWMITLTALLLGRGANRSAARASENSES